MRAAVNPTQISSEPSTSASLVHLAVLTVWSLEDSISIAGGASSKGWGGEGRASQTH